MSKFERELVHISATWEGGDWNTSNGCVLIEVTHIWGFNYFFLGQHALGWLATTLTMLRNKLRSCVPCLMLLHHTLLTR